MVKKTMVAVALLVIMVAGCAGTLVKPETVPQGLLYGYGLVEGVTGSVETLYRAGILPHNDAVDAYNKLLSAKAKLDKANELYNLGEALKSKEELDSAMGIVELLRDYLLERSKE